MGLFFVYILKSSVCLAIFYLFYRLLLARETFHRFNRFSLLGILLLSCLLPLVEVSVKQETEVHQTMLTLEQLLMMADAVNATEAGASAETATVTWIQVALLVYLAGIVFFAFRNVCSLVRLLMLLKSGKKEDIGSYLPSRKERVTLIVHNRDIAPFSWMGYIVISRKNLEENGREILIHELAHIHNRHSWDLLVADVCIFFQWFNPASWLLKQELQNIHEFEADETVIKEGVDAKQYQLLLIKKAVGTRLYSMANSFNHSKLKKRITMMLKEKQVIGYLGKEKRTALYNFLYLCSTVKSRSKIGYIRIDFHPFVQLRHFTDTRATAGIPEVQDHRTAHYIGISPLLPCGIFYFELWKGFTYPFLCLQSPYDRDYRELLPYPSTITHQKGFRTRHLFSRSSVFSHIFRQHKIPAQTKFCNLVSHAVLMYNVGCYIIRIHTRWHAFEEKAIH